MLKDWCTSSFEYEYHTQEMEKYMNTIVHWEDSKKSYLIRTGHAKVEYTMDVPEIHQNHHQNS